MSNKQLAGIIVSGLIYTFQNDLAKLIKTAYNHCIDRLYSQLIITAKINPKCLVAIKEVILEGKRLKYEARDGQCEPNYGVANGRYTVSYKNTRISIIIDDEHVELMVFWKEANFLKEFLNATYRRYCKPNDLILFYGSKDCSWSFPIFRRARDLKNIKTTADMKEVLDDIQRFTEGAKSFETNGYPYRKGYLLEGPPGTGKTTISEIVAIKHNRSVYKVTLNAKNMTDESLTNLISSVPPMSVIIFDELEDQLKTLQKNSKNSVSHGGILSAIDGPERLSYGTIVILTVNDICNFPNNFRTQLLRKGRIDMHYKLSTKIT